MGLIDANKLGSAGAVIRGGLDSQGKPAAVSMQYGNNLSITVEMQREVRAAIERAFLVPLFQSLTQTKQMTGDRGGKARDGKIHAAGADVRTHRGGMAVGEH